MIRWWRRRRDRWHLGLDGQCWDPGCRTHRDSSQTSTEVDVVPDASLSNTDAPSAAADAGRAADAPGPYPSSALPPDGA